MPSHRIAALIALAAASFCMPAVAAFDATHDAPFWTLDAPAQAAPQPVPPLLAATDQVAPVTTEAAKPQVAKRLRRVLADLSMSLRHIRYQSGGKDPSTGFDCSGFVRYVFRHGAGAELPIDSASQYRAGRLVAREDMKTGDLVFFKINGKRISHVGIYIGKGRFIHAPSKGKAVSISRLDNSYWSKRFAGAKRPEVLS